MMFDQQFVFLKKEAEGYPEASFYMS